MNVDLPISFTKMSGTGNDFIIIDHRQPFLDENTLADFTRAVCRRKFSVGADGLILIENSDKADFEWKFFNGDGSSAEMCGNGARCAARFAYSKKIAPAKMRFLTLAGIIEAEVIDGSVKIRMTPPENVVLNIPLNIDGDEKIIHSINTGVPHAIIFMEDVAEAPVFEWGRIVRYHEHFQPAGTNVNFVQHISDNEFSVRTYERGVEGETMACGTGAVAAAIVGGLLGYVKPPIKVVTFGGDRLVVHFSISKEEPVVTDVFLEGPAEFIYEGQLEPGALKGEF